MEPWEGVFHPHLEGYVCPHFPTAAAAADISLAIRRMGRDDTAYRPRGPVGRPGRGD